MDSPLYGAVAEACQARIEATGRLGVRNFLALLIAKAKELGLAGDGKLVKAVAHAAYAQFVAPYTPGDQIDVVILGLLDSIIDQLLAQV